MITYSKACKMANEIREKTCPSYEYTSVFELPDRWAFFLSPCPLDGKSAVVAPPSFFISREDGRMEWFSIPPLENLDLLESGKKIPFID